MSATLSEMNNLQIWNAARGIAKQSLSPIKSVYEKPNLTVEKDGVEVSITSQSNIASWTSIDLESLRSSYDELASEEDLWPFGSFEDYLIAVDDVGVHRIEDDYPDMHQEFSNLVSNRLQDIKRGEFNPSAGKPPKSVLDRFEFESIAEEPEAESEDEVSEGSEEENREDDATDLKGEGKNTDQDEDDSDTEVGSVRDTNTDEVEDEIGGDGKIESTESEIQTDTERDTSDSSSESQDGVQPDSESDEDHTPTESDEVASSAPEDSTTVDTSDDDRTDTESTEGGEKTPSDPNHHTDGDTDEPLQDDAEKSQNNDSSDLELDDNQDVSDEELSLDIADPEVEAVSLDLYRCFISREGVSYSDLLSKYDQKLPPRSILLTEVINASGESKTERVEKIADWVAEWFDNPDVLQELDKYAHRPMGSRIRS